MLEIEHIPVELQITNGMAPGISFKGDATQDWRILCASHEGKNEWSFSRGLPLVCIPMVPILLKQKYGITGTIAIVLEIVNSAEAWDKSKKVLIGTPLFDVETTDGPRYQLWLGVGILERS